MAATSAAQPLKEAIREARPDNAQHSRGAGGEAAGKEIGTWPTMRGIPAERAAEPRARKLEHGRQCAAFPQ